MKITGLTSFGFIPQKPIKTGSLQRVNNSYMKSEEYTILPNYNFINFGKRIDLKDYKDEIEKLHNEGKTAREIAEIIGCSPSAISLIISKWRKENENI